MTSISKVTRKAILIGSQGPKSNFLNGVPHDLKNLKNYLLSDEGGCWHEDEIFVLNNPTLAQLRPFIETSNEDYVLVYFSGHGSTNENGFRMLALDDYLVPDTFLLRTQTSRQLVIVDACRNFVNEGLSGIPDHGPKIDHFDGSATRSIFDQCILQSPYGKMIVHATQSGQRSFESKDGGHFTQSLLDVSYHALTSQYTTFGIEQILGNVGDLLLQFGNHQQPHVTYSLGTLQVPFAIGVPPQFKTIRKRKSSNKENSLAPVLLIGLAIVIVAVAASN